MKGFITTILVFGFMAEMGFAKGTFTCETMEMINGEIYSFSFALENLNDAKSIEYAESEGSHVIVSPENSYIVDLNSDALVSVSEEKRLLVLPASNKATKTQMVIFQFSDYKNGYLTQEGTSRADFLFNTVKCEKS